MTLPPLHEPADWPVAPELRVTDPAAAGVLWHPDKRLYLRPFLGRSCGLAEAAALLAVRKTAMSYWIKRLLALGLIRARGQARCGRQMVPVYRCVADRLRLRLADAPHASYEAVVDEASARWRRLTRAALGRAVARQAPWLDMCLQVDGAAGMGIVLAPSGPGAPADDMVHYWGRLWLSPQECDALREELDALWDRYAALSDARGKPRPMLLHLVSVPEPPRGTRR